MSKTFSEKLDRLRSLETNITNLLREYEEECEYSVYSINLFTMQENGVDRVVGVIVKGDSL